MSKIIIPDNNQAKLENRFFAGFCFMALTLALFSCRNNKEDAAKYEAGQQQMEQAKAYSIAKAEAEQQRKNSILAADLKEVYANAITITPGNKTSVPSTLGEGSDVPLSCTVANNSPIPLSASDYSLTCVETFPNSSDGTVPDGYRPVSAKSKDPAPGESFNVQFSAKITNDLSKPKVKMKISEEDFVKRALEANK